MSFKHRQRKNTYFHALNKNSIIYRKTIAMQESITHQRKSMQYHDIRTYFNNLKQQYLIFFKLRYDIHCVGYDTCSFFLYKTHLIIIFQLTTFRTIIFS